MFLIILLPLFVEATVNFKEFYYSFYISIEDKNQYKNLPNNSLLTILSRKQNSGPDRPVRFHCLTGSSLKQDKATHSQNTAALPLRPTLDSPGSPLASTHVPQAKQVAAGTGVLRAGEHAALRPEGL